MDTDYTSTGLLAAEQTGFLWQTTPSGAVTSDFESRVNFFCVDKGFADETEVTFLTPTFPRPPPPFAGSNDEKFKNPLMQAFERPAGLQNVG